MDSYDVLLIGNAPMPALPDLDRYRDVVVFNNVTPRWALPYATIHWCVRLPYTEPIDFVGIDLGDEHHAQFILRDEAMKTMHRELPAGRVLRRLQGTEIVDPQTYELTPSTGYVAIQYYLQQGRTLTLYGFTWQGWSGHDWDREMKDCLKWRDEGRVYLRQIPAVSGPAGYPSPTP
jgi:hypothetical protein